VETDRHADPGRLIPLSDGSRVVVIGGGPAGSFFALTLLRQARAEGRNLSMEVLERRLDPNLAGLACGTRASSSCNFCAGGISPRMSDVLTEMGIEVPQGIVQNEVRRIIVQSHWKNLELKVPAGRRMYTVYRGSRPVARAFRTLNFDALLLSTAAEEGVRVTSGEAVGFERSAAGLPAVRYRGIDGVEILREADFLVHAGGVNPVLGADLPLSPLVADLARLVPGFAPPQTRETMIFELEVTPDLAAGMADELTFILHGSSELRIEMGSIMPKGRFVTVALIGPDIERDRVARHGRELVSTFLSLPHVARVLPRDQIRALASCICRPNMVVGSATRPFGDRVAVIGDMATSRLYKDGIYSAFLTGSALARAALAAGIDRGSLARRYRPLVRRLEADQRSGRAVFRMVSLSFRNPLLSRMTYQAVLRERRLADPGSRHLEGILWQVASGDESYQDIVRAMQQPRTLLSFFFRGVLVTLRNLATEAAFGLSWQGIGRYPTGVYREDLKNELDKLRQRGVDTSELQHFRRMYSIRIRASAEEVLAGLAQFGEPDCPWFCPRFVEVRRTEGAPHEAGSRIRYNVVIGALSFEMKLERLMKGRLLAYRVQNGFAQGGLLVFDVDERRPRDSVFSILVAFNFRSGGGAFRGAVWALYRLLFPSFAHDVVWNHALCGLKSAVESPSARKEVESVGVEVPSREDDPDAIAEA
jgi:flavin-dependent dehydrogenase